MTAADVARVVGGAVEGSAIVRLFGAEVDSRRLEDGDLFVALPGARRDGHEFVGQALETAAAALVRRDADLEEPPSERAEVGQSPRPLVVREITTAHRQALSKQHLGEAAHTNATNTHQVEMTSRHTPPPIDKTRSAMRAAAFGSATSRAERPMSRSAS